MTYAPANPTAVTQRNAWASTLRKLSLVAAVVAAVTVFLAYANPAESWWVPKCPLWLLTGLQCPACGIQRFVYAMAHGHPLEAIAYNYYLAYSLPYLLLFGVRWSLPKDSRARQRLSWAIEHPRVLWFYIITFFLWFIVRNLLHI